MKTNDSANPRVDRNEVAAMLSVVPGAGHLYKHHYVSGMAFLIGGNLLVGLVSALMVLGTFGLSLLLVPSLYIAAVAWSAYNLPDWHGRHAYLHPWQSPEHPPQDDAP